MLGAVAVVGVDELGAVGGWASSHSHSSASLSVCGVGARSPGVLALVLFVPRLGPNTQIEPCPVCGHDSTGLSVSIIVIVRQVVGRRVFSLSG